MNFGNDFDNKMFSINLESKHNILLGFNDDNTYLIVNEIYNYTYIIIIMIHNYGEEELWIIMEKKSYG